VEREEKGRRQERKGEGKACMKERDGMG